MSTETNPAAGDSRSDDDNRSDYDSDNGVVPGADDGHPGGTEAGAGAGQAAGGLARTRVPKTNSSKSEQTRTLILETALRLFRERGYDRTTMRAIAEEAGVSVGNAYYYFASKEHLVQGFYDLIADEHRERLPARLADKRDFGDRLRTALDVWMAIAAPYHEFSAQLFKNAADPASPLSPFSAESEPARNAVIELYRGVLAGSDAKLDADIAELLPELLWLYHMGIVLYWVYDRSPDTVRTTRLVARATAVVARLVALSRFKILRPLVREAKDLLSEFVLVQRRAGTGT
ncbi:MAG TPA: TetR family transcriptional regulator [Actinocrinis sp.]|uniref:TetR family transcriptional regulator n=1 Tax=Actinocrinis sp. TaxID=1920516 RepID=UPI002DDD5D07|nr:TetR family transcriptional regulator [Actinocrinis sp.]HEV2343432.1 TetR family transcriptional regulator [Actinocrinis sp.]